MNDRATTLLEGRREKMERALGRPLAVPEPAGGADLSEPERDHLRDAATDLYLNELAWENITDEEEVEGEPLAELAFPGFLAFVQGLLLDRVMPDSLAPANPRPEIAEDVVRFLAERVVALQDGMGEPVRTVTSRGHGTSPSPIASSTSFCSVCTGWTRRMPRVSGTRRGRPDTGAGPNVCLRLNHTV